MHTAGASHPGGAGHALLFDDHVLLKTDFKVCTCQFGITGLPGAKMLALHGDTHPKLHFFLVTSPGARMLHAKHGIADKAGTQSD